MAAKGILGRKLGMTQVWDDENRVVPVTVIQAGPCRVVQLKTPERDGYAAVQLAFGETKPAAADQARARPPRARPAPPPAAHLAELRVDDLSGFEVGQVIAADVFAAGERVDVTGISKGKGFTGVMKRHNFKGQGASHGNHKKHRAPARSARAPRRPRVFKGMRMAGQHGRQQGHHAQPRGRRGRRRARPAAREGLGARPGRRPRVRPQRGEGPGDPDRAAAPAERAPETAETRREARPSRSVTGQEAGTVDASRRPVRHRAEHRGHAPGRHRAARGQRVPARTAPRPRAEVAGGGAKPWRQKGTGRARQGSIRSPQWRGGGIAHGPKPRDYTQRTPKKMVRLALRSALSDRAADGRVHRGRRLGHRRAQDEARHRDPRRARPADQGRARRRVLLVLDRDRGRGLEVVPQPRRPGADRAARGAQRLRRARQRLGRVQQGDARQSADARARQPPAPTSRRAATPRRRSTSDRPRDPRDIIIRPVVSEKSYAALRRATSTRSSSPTTPTRSRSARRSRRSSASRSRNVNTLNRQGKRKRNRRTGNWGQRSGQKRAIVSLAEGDTIEIFGS